MSGNAALQSRLQYKFSNKALLREALTHASSITKSDDATYERLEFLGDRVLGLAIAEALYEAFSDAKEGELAPRLTSLVRAETCAAVASELGLGDSLILGESEIQTGGKEKPALLADVIEAVIGAIFIDGGYAPARDFVYRHWRGHLEKSPQNVRDAKTMLQEWAQGQGYPLPHYETVERSGPDHAPQFEISVKVAHFKPARGAGASKRQAEQAAAENFLKRENAWPKND
jgi:ribonuclease-3